MRISNKLGSSARRKRTLRKPNAAASVAGSVKPLYLFIMDMPEPQAKI